MYQKTTEQFVEDFMEYVKARDPHQKEFHQAVHEVVGSLAPFLLSNPRYIKAKIMERMVEPERVITFRVPWVDDRGDVHVNRGYRIEMNSAIGPYKGGLRFHPTVNLATLKFLAFEQVLKNSLTSLPMGGGKGGSDFDPKNKSDNEVMRFCQSFMTELQRHIGPNTDVPAGDIGVGGREIGYLFGQYKRLRNEFTGVLTGKGVGWGGSLIRPEATGFGSVYFAEEMMKLSGDTINGKTVLVSGFGNVSWGVTMKASQLGAKVVTISGPDGFVYDPDGIGTPEKWNFMLELRASNNDVVQPYSERFPNATFYPGEKPWGVKADMAFPCAIQNELDIEDAEKLVANGCRHVVETSNMGCTERAVTHFLEKKIFFAPGKAANAGGVAVSGLEMTQNSMRLSWSREEVDEKLHSIMKNIHEMCIKYGRQEDGWVNYVSGANIGGFVKVADAMIAQGYV
ncbi:MAG: NADP-specific glutamate dehydrogenase [Prolixibacteraceae bacterium]|jgi:glutamate dehydrogenase/leucine dehydrogenase|nr:NADP-specific glutamate dehydrogenase [Prolixibacteraceae bacterium]